MIPEPDNVFHAFLNAFEKTMRIRETWKVARNDLVDKLYSGTPEHKYQARCRLQNLQNEYCEELADLAGAFGGVAGEIQGALEAAMPSITDAIMEIVGKKDLEAVVEIVAEKIKKADLG